MNVDDWAADEKKRLTVYARYMRQTGRRETIQSEPDWREAFRQHCIRANRMALKEVK